MEERLQKASEKFRVIMAKELDEVMYLGKLPQEEYNYFLTRIVSHMYQFVPREIQNDVDWCDKNFFA